MPSDEYINSLEPRSQRYDVAVEDDFVISVLPNGIRTWAFVYEYEGRSRRKTLGVYPDMPEVEARRALASARAMFERLEEPLEQELPLVGDNGTRVADGAREARQRSGSRDRHSARSRGSTFRNLVLLALGAIVLIIAGVAGREWRGGQTGSAVPVETSTQKAGPASRAAVPGQVVPGLNSAAKSPPDAMRGTGVALSTPENSVPGANTLSTPTQASTRPDSSTQSMPEARDPAEAGDNANERPVALSDGIATGGALSVPTANTEPVSSDGAALETTALQSVSVAAEITAVNTGAAGDAAKPSLSQQSGAGSAPSAPAVTGIVSPKVARAIVTSGVEKLEPVDEIGPVLPLPESGYTRLYFYNELREAGPGNVVHRWEYGGEVVAEVTLKVGAGWRWRTYSRKDLLPGMTGLWRVTVLDENGSLLAAREFEYR